MCVLSVLMWFAVVCVCLAVRHQIKVKFSENVTTNVQEETRRAEQLLFSVYLIVSGADDRHPAQLKVQSHH